jgi:sortase A
MSARSWTRKAGAVAATAGALTLMYVGFVLAEAKTFQATFHLSDAPSAVAIAASSSSSTAAAAIPDGTGLGELRIPRLGMNIVVAQGDSRNVLRRGAGHLADSPWLGQAGNIVLAGHRDTVFRSLRDIKVGDVINVVSPDEQAWYQVASTVVVAPDDLTVLQPSAGNTLTLVTCYPFGFFGSAPNRFVVRATEIR